MRYGSSSKPYTKNTSIEDKGKGEPFGSLARTTAVLDGFPKLKAVVGTFRASPGMQHYLSVRGDAGKVKW